MGKIPGAKLACLTTSGDPGHWSRGIYDAALASDSWTDGQRYARPAQLGLGIVPRRTASAPSRVGLPPCPSERMVAPEDRLTNIDDVHACATLDGPLDPMSGRRYVIGVDLGITNDRTVCAVMHAEKQLDGAGRNVVQRYVLDRLEVWTPSHGNPVDLTAVEEWYALAARAVPGTRHHRPVSGRFNDSAAPLEGHRD